MWLKKVGFVLDQVSYAFAYSVKEQVLILLFDSLLFNLCLNHQGSEFSHEKHIFPCFLLCSGSFYQKSPGHGEEGVV